WHHVGLTRSGALVNLLSGAWADGRVVAAACHGRAGLVNVKEANGQPLVAGRRVSPFAKRMSRETGLPVAESWGIDDPRMAEHVIAGR
ncbi:hypothetical protein AAIG97_34440, partial [Pseudomonas aeruginosa]